MEGHLEQPEFDRLEPLVRAVCELESRCGLTPVLVIDPRLVLADDFYISLCRGLIERTGRTVRLDLLPGHRFGLTGGGVEQRKYGWKGPWLPAPVASAILRPLRRFGIRRIASRLPQEARIESTLAVARPGGPLRDLVVGLAGPADELPRFAQQIAIGIVPS
jgi:hypothetical protein